MSAVVMAPLNSATRVLALGVVLAAMASASGCSVATGVLYLQPEDKFYRVVSEGRRPDGIERMPEVSVDIGVIQIGCTMFERDRYAVHQVRQRWGLDTKLIMGGYALLESWVAASLYFRPKDLPGDERTNQITGVVLGADVLATLAWIVFLHQRDYQGDTVDHGPWRKLPDYGGCGNEMALEYQGHLVPLQPSGRPDPATERWLVDRLVLEGGDLHIGMRAPTPAPGPPRLAAPGLRVLRYGNAERCALARSVGHPAAASICFPAPGP